ncbi:MAG: chitobiase/beta-hexosaminidase C-terminal domain-containing protein, partial [Bryobacteraceae bacterium]
NSTVSTATYTIRAVAPTFSPAGGTSTTPQTVTLSTATNGASINYTTDGSAPSDTAGTLYTGPITVSGTTTIKAVAFASGLTNSTVSTATYTIRAVAPTFSPAGGTSTTPQTVMLSTATSGASINYTTDGSAPSNTAGTLYAGPITVSGTTTIKAVAFASGLTDSTVSTATYTIRAVAPTFSPTGGTSTTPQTVTLSTTTAGSSINYTTNGSAPSATAGTLYTGPITVSGTTTIKAVAFASGLTDSTVSTATYKIRALWPRPSALQVERSLLRKR